MDQRPFENDVHFPKQRVHADAAILANNEDELNRGDFAKRLAEILVDNKSDDSLVVGLYGKWGDGKTSVINLALEWLNKPKKQKPIIIHFNPWYFADTEHLFFHFFHTLALGLQQKTKEKNYKRASALLNSLSLLCETLKLIPNSGVQAIINSLRTLTLGVGDQFSNLAVNAGDIYEIKKEISGYLCQEKRRIVIIIDDIDRLQANEICAIFQLVRGIGDFKKVSYLLAFDQMIAIDALHKKCAVDGAEYLEKIISMPMHLPRPDSRKMRSFIAWKLDRFCLEYHFDPVSVGKRSFELLFYLNRCCSNIRKLRRFENIIHSDITGIEIEIDPADYLGITAIKEFHPKVFQFIRDNRAYVIDTGPWVVSRALNDSEAKKTIEDFLVNEDHAAVLLNLIKSLFPRVRSLFDTVSVASSEQADQQSRREKRICHPSNFDIYFQLAVYETDVSSQEMNLLLGSLNRNTLESTIKNALQNSDEQAEKALNYLQGLLDHLDDDAVQSHTKEVIIALFNVRDLFPKKSVQNFFLNGTMLIQNIVNRLLNTIPEEQERYDILAEAINNAQDSLGGMVHFIWRESQAHGRYIPEAQQTTERAPRLISDDHLDILESTALTRIKQWANESNRLADHDELIFILHRWRELSKKDNDVSHYLLDTLDFSNFIRVVRWVLTEGDPLDEGDSLNLKKISTLVNIQGFMQRVNAILEGPDKASLTSESKALLERIARQQITTDM